MTDQEQRDRADEPPPILGSWRNFYALVLAVLILEIVLFTILTKALS